MPCVCPTKFGATNVITPASGMAANGVENGDGGGGGGVDGVKIQQLQTQPPSSPPEMRSAMGGGGGGGLYNAHKLRVSTYLSTTKAIAINDYNSELFIFRRGF